MKDKELQELFAAKRTLEANRRRQQQIAKALVAGKHKHTLWPLWTGAAAAAVAAVILLALPKEQAMPTASPVQIAQVTTPSMPETTEPIIIQRPTRTATKVTEPDNTINHIIDTIVTTGTIVAIETDTIAPIVTIPTRTTHRRRSTGIVQQDNPRRESIFQILAERISIDTTDSPLIKCINIKTSTI